MNEGVIRSPKWMRNFVDFEVNTGDDIKGEPSKKKQKKIDAEKERLKKEKETRDEEEREARRERQEKRQQQQKQQQDAEFEKLFNIVLSYIVGNYKDCYIYVEINHQLTVEKNDLTSTLYKELEFKVILDDSETIPKFKVYIKANDKIYNYIAKGLLYTKHISFFRSTIYDFYRLGYAKKKPSGSSNSKYKSSSYNSNSRTKSKEELERENKERRYNSLKDVLSGFNRELNKLKTSGAKQSDIDIVLSQIKNAKDKLNNMNKKFHFESIYYFKHMKSIFS